MHIFAGKKRACVTVSVSTAGVSVSHVNGAIPVAAYKHFRVLL